MNEIEIPSTKTINRNSTVEEISAFMDLCPRQPVTFSPWDQLAVLPEVSFGISWSQDCIFLKYFVNEPAIRAVCMEDNMPVYEDSCVEFFIAFDESNYYNLEFNCTGACLAGFGAKREGRALLPVNDIELIKRYSYIKRNTSSGYAFYWELLLIIPLKIFSFHPALALDTVNCRGNFYKCGDKLPTPHFLAWNHISTDSPDFHQPAFFGLLHFK